MLDNIPNMRARFTKFNAEQSFEALKNDAEFVKQVKLIQGGLDSLISNLNNPGQLQATMERLAEVHLRMQPSIGLEYFKPLQEKIASFLAEKLGSDDTPKSWERLLAAFNEVLNSYLSYNIGLSEAMFDNVPNMRERFTKFNARESDDALKSNAEFQKQVDVIIGGFETLINNLNDPALLQDRLENLAEAHLNKKPAIGNSYFVPLQKKINLFIETALGVSSDSEEAKAWSNLVGALNRVIKDHAVNAFGLSNLMLENVPNMRSRFNKFNARQSDDNLKKDAEFRRQVSLITGGLESLINNLNNPDRLHDTFERLADAHLNLKPRVGLEYFEPLQQNINVYIEKSLGVSSDSAVSRSWTSLITAFNNFLRDTQLFFYVVYFFKRCFRPLFQHNRSDKKALQSSWSRLTSQAGSSQNAGINLVLWMLDNVPNMRDRFTKFNGHSSDDALRKDTEFLKQVNVITGGLESLINNVNDADQLKAAIERLVEVHLHMTPSVGLEYFGPLQQNIRFYIQSALGVESDSVEGRAWSRVLQVFNEFLADRTSEKIGLSDTDRKLLASSWKQLKGNGNDLVFWMFNNVPNMREQFSKFNAFQSDEDLQKDADFVIQRDNIISGLDSLINSLDKPGQLQKTLENIADFHLEKKPSVGLEFFGPLQKYLHLYIESTLNVAPGSAEARAWTNLLTALNNVIRDHAIERLGLTANDRKALDSSWKKLRSGAGGRKNAGVKLVLWMLSNVPNMRSQFSKFDANQPDFVLKQNAEFLNQVDRILGGIESLVNTVNDPVALKAAIDKLADAHLSMPSRIGLDFFGPLQQNIAQYIQQELGVSADSGESKAWPDLFAAYNRVLKERTVLKIISDNEKAALKRSWKALVDAAGSQEGAAVNLVLWMFKNIPKMPERFTKFNGLQSDDDLRKDTEFIKQANDIAGGLVSLVNNIDIPGKLLAAIDRLVDVHLNMRPSVGLEYFGPLEEKIAQYLVSALGVTEDSNEAKSWTRLLNAFNTVLREDSLQKIGLSDVNRKSLESSWNKLADVAGGKDKAGTNLVLWLLDNVPKMRDRFTKFNAYQSDDALRTDQEFVNQVQRITQGIDSLIDNVNNPAGLQSGIERLVDAHLNMQPSIGLVYFGSVQQYIHLYIAKTLGVPGTSDEATSWTNLWAAFNKVLKQHSLQKLGIGDSERKILVSSWKKLTIQAGGQQNFGVNLVLWMLDNVPNMRDQFTKFNARQSNDDLKRDAGFLKQVKKIIGGLGSLVDSLNDPGQLQASLERLAAVHLNFIPSVGVEFFEPLERKINVFIEQTLRLDNNSAESKAWTRLIGTFNRVLKEQTLQQIGISDRDRKALGSSWKLLTTGEDGIRRTGISLVLWMFNNIPNVRDRFTRFNPNQPDDALKADPKFLKQVDVTIGNFKSFVDNVNDPIKLQFNMDRVAEAHLNMGASVAVNHFKILAQKIHGFVEKSLGVTQDSDESQAWTNLFTTFQKTLRNREVLRTISNRDKSELVSSWNRLVEKAGSRQNAGVELVLWMLEKVPNMRNKFTKFNANQPDDVLRNNAEFLNQVNLIAGGLESLVKNVNNPGRLLDALERLSSAHLNMQPSVGLEYFQPLQQKIASYIANALGVAVDSDKAKAWSNILAAFNKIHEFSSINKIGLSDSNKEALVSSWNTLIASGQEKAGVDLVLWMFENIPNMRKRFTKFDATQSNDNLKNDSEFTAQSNRIVGGLDSLIKSVNQPGELQANLEKLVDVHLHLVPSVGLEYFEPLQQYIHLYIEKSLGVSSNSVEAKAWTGLLHAFNNVLREHSVKKIGLSDVDRKSIVSSWKKLASRAGSKLNAGINLVLWMLKNVAKARERFTKFNAFQPDVTLVKDKGFIDQVNAITNGLESLVNNVENPGQFQAALERLSTLHKNKTPSIGMEYFGPFQKYIHLYIEKSLNVDPNSQEPRAWTNMFASFNEVLKKT
nr:hemoglobin type 2; partial [Biomphalaria glabrata]